jgi:putative ABC transport system ATP-binding protein
VSALAIQGVGLGRSFGKGETLTVALREVSLDLRGGQFTLVMGPSGCGKSTLLAVLSGLLRPDRGTVLALRQDLWAMSEARRRDFRLRHFGFIFQGYNLFPTLTAREHLEMMVRWGEGAGRSEARRRAQKILDVLGLGGRAHCLPAELSGGEKQRVAIGRSLIKNPAICFADEPTGALDWDHGSRVIEQLVRSSRSGATVLVVAHDSRIIPYADQVVYLRDGARVEAETSSAG